MTISEVANQIRQSENRLIWENGVLTQTDIPVHNAEADDGGLGFVSPDEIGNELFSARPLLPGDYTETENSDDRFLIEGVDWKVEVRPVDDFAESFHQLSESKEAADVSDVVLTEVLKKRYKQCACFLQSISYGEQLLLGYTMLVEDYFSGNWEIRYCGTGSVTIIRERALSLFSTFSLELDIE